MSGSYYIFCRCKDESKFFSECREHIEMVREVHSPFLVQEISYVTGDYVN